MRVGCIVEGHGETDGVPVLLRRLATSWNVSNLEIPVVIRTPRDKLKAAGEVERVVEQVATKLQGQGVILLVVDSEDDCPAALGPAFLTRATATRSDLEIAVVLAKAEFEAWFIAAAPSLAGKRDLPPDLEAPADPEAIRGAKEWLTSQMRRTDPSRRYAETRDQAALAAQFDFELASRTSPSFDKFLREARRLLGVGGDDAAAT